jgi:AcrR family transcriptional regulator
MAADSAEGPAANGGGSSASTAERILDAAEALFAKRGYYGVTIREVAALSGTELSLTRYHFGSKDDLFRSVIERRARPVTQTSLRALEAALETSGGAPLSLQEVVRTWVVPIATLPQTDKRWSNWLKLMIHSDSLSDRPELLAPIRDAYVPVFAAYLRELVRSGVPEERAGWLLHFIHMMVAHTGYEVYELEKLTKGLCDAADSATLLARVVEFISGGAMAFGSAQSPVARTVAPKAATKKKSARRKP